MSVGSWQIVLECNCWLNQGFLVLPCRSRAYSIRGDPKCPNESLSPLPPWGELDRRLIPPSHYGGWFSVCLLYVKMVWRPHILFRLGLRPPLWCGCQSRVRIVLFWVSSVLYTMDVWMLVSLVSSSDVRKNDWEESNTIFPRSSFSECIGLEFSSEPVQTSQRAQRLGGQIQP